MRLAVFVAAAIAAPLAGQLREIEIRFEGVGCASCIESLPGRVQRMRGVEKAEVDAARGVIRLSLAPGNRVRLELVRDAIEQDGTKARSAQVRVEGEVTREGRLKFPGGEFALQGKPAPEGVQEISGDIADLRPASGPMILVVREARTR